MAAVGKGEWHPGAFLRTEAFGHLSAGSANPKRIAESAEDATTELASLPPKMYSLLAQP